MSKVRTQNYVWKSGNVNDGAFVQHVMQERKNKWQILPYTKTQTFFVFLRRM